MNIISLDSGTAIQRIQSDEVRPLYGFNIPETIRLVAERYGFSQRPSPIEAAKDGAKFRDGRLITGHSTINIQEMNVGGDFFGLTAYETDGADFILNDLMTWGRQALGLREPVTKFPRQYHSVIVVDFEKDPEQIFSALKTVQDVYAEMMHNLYGFTGRLGATRFAFARDQQENPAPAALPLGDIQWTFERRVGVPFASNRYISGAPVRTEMNIKLVEMIESLLR